MDILSDILHTVKVHGSLYFRTDFTPPWGLRVPSFQNVARFHLVTRGSCLARISGINANVLLQTGDLIVITRGAEHHLSDENSEPPFTSVDEAVTKSGFDGHGAFHWGSAETGHQPTELVCGHFAFASARGKLLLDALPAFIHIPNTKMRRFGWLDAATKFIADEVFGGELGSAAIINRLAEIIFIQTVRAYAKTQKEPNGLFAALTDASISRVMLSIHRDPGADWTVDSLARVAGVSRTILSERMKTVLGIPPIAYLTHWRMELAHEALADSKKGMAEIGEAVGYQSLSAFSRKFKKHFGYTPGAVRSEKFG